MQSIWGQADNKTPPGEVFVTSKRELFDFRFFVDHVLANNWIEFFSSSFSGLVRLFFVVV